MSDKSLELCTENLTVRKAALAATSGADLLYALKDSGTDTFWQSQNSASGATETITLTFTDEYGAPCAAVIDRIVLQNTNAAKISAQYTNSDGETVAIAEAALSGLSTNEARIALDSPIKAAALMLTIESTQDGGEKKLGGLLVTKSLCTLSASTTLERSDYWRTGNFYTADGSLVLWREYARAAATLSVKEMAREQSRAIRLALEESPYLCILPGADYHDGAAAHYAVTSAPREYYDPRTGLCELTLELRQS